MRQPEARPPWAALLSSVGSRQLEDLFFFSLCGDLHVFDLGDFFSCVYIKMKLTLEKAVFLKSMKHLTQLSSAYERSAVTLSTEQASFLTPTTAVPFHWLSL